MRDSSKRPVVREPERVRRERYFEQEERRDRERYVRKYLEPGGLVLLTTSSTRVCKKGVYEVRKDACRVDGDLKSLEN